MKIAVLGGGNGCYAAAIELTENGHEVRLWRRDAASLQPVIDQGGLSIKDRHGERDITIATVTASLEEAIAGARAAGNAATRHQPREPGSTVAPLLENEQVVFFPPGTFASFIFARALKESGNAADVTFCETGTLPYLARKHSPTRVVIVILQHACPLAHCLKETPIIPSLCWSRLTPRFERTGNALSGALMNAGGIIHPPLIMMNAGHWSI